MMIRDRKPVDRPGIAWEYREGCRCSLCPWKGDCIGEHWPHWIGRKIDKQEPHR